MQPITPPASRPEITETKKNMDYELQKKAYLYRMKGRIKYEGVLDDCKQLCVDINEHRKNKETDYNTEKNLITW